MRPGPHTTRQPGTRRTCHRSRLPTWRRPSPQRLSTAADGLPTPSTRYAHKPTTQTTTAAASATGARSSSARSMPSSTGCRNAGQPGGAPVRTSVETVSQVINGKHSGAGHSTQLRRVVLPVPPRTTARARSRSQAPIRVAPVSRPPTTPLTDRRQPRPAPSLHRAVHDQPANHVQVLLRGLRRQRRGGADPAGAGAAEEERRSDHRLGR